MVTYDDFTKVELRSGTVIKAEAFPKAKKPAYKLRVDLGSEIGIKRSSVQIVKNYKKEDLKGKSCTIFTNLEPRKIKGIESQGMLLAAVNEDESGVKIIQSDIEPGSKVR